MPLARPGGVGCG